MRCCRPLSSPISSRALHPLCLTPVTCPRHKGSVSTVSPSRPSPVHAFRLASFRVRRGRSLVPRCSHHASMGDAGGPSFANLSRHPGIAAATSASPFAPSTRNVYNTCFRLSPKSNPGRSFPRALEQRGKPIDIARRSSRFHSSL